MNIHVCILYIYILEIIGTAKKKTVLMEILIYIHKNTNEIIHW